MRRRQHLLLCGLAVLNAALSSGQQPDPPATANPLTATSAAVKGAAGERLYALPTYTALLELRDLLARRGLAKRWSD